MLEQAIKAGLPLIMIETTDTTSFSMIVKHLVGQDPIKVGPGPDKLNKVQKGELHMYDCKRQERGSSFVNMYKEFSKNGTQVILVNPKKPLYDEAFDAGIAPVPRELVEKELKRLKLSNSVQEGILASCGGLNLREIVEVCQLTLARDENITANGFAITRRQLVPDVNGLNLVDTHLDVYTPSEKLSAYTKSQKMFFFEEDTDHRLVPRGLLFDGPPGTGKTMGAKYLASEWGLPLYRLDAGVNSKWHGESEANLRRALATVDTEEPCVVLIDEIEKFFGSSKMSSSASGVGSNMIGTLLWWLAEHRTRVFVVMTCNKKDAIPPEMYREGRIDGVLTFYELKMDEAKKLVTKVLDSFDFGDGSEEGVGLKKEAKKLALKDLNNNVSDGETISHARVATMVSMAVKEAVLKHAG